jgi:hypothetical protein
MAGRKTAGGIRSGRFSGLVDKQIVIATNAQTGYRIFNTGEAPFTVNVQIADTSESPPPNVSVAKNCSIDLDVPNGGYVQITPNETAEGVFNQLDLERPIRSGRFASSDAHTTPLVVIERSRSRLYRFLNSGKRLFDIYKIDPAIAGNLIGTVDIDCSLDLYLPGQDKQIFIKSREDKRVAGVLEALTPNFDANGVRSGRFSFEGPATKLQTVIEFPNISNGGDVHHYRVTNAGDRPFILLKNGVSIPGTGADSKPIPLQPDQSIDFQIVEVSSPDPIVTVNSTIDNATITGIYDYLGMAK